MLGLETLRHGRQFVVRAASLWELILKAGKKDALLANPVRWWEKNVTAQAIRVLSIRVSYVSLLEELPPIHKTRLTAFW